VESVADWYRESSSVPPERFAQTLAHVADRIAEGTDPRVGMREFLDELAIRPTRELRLAAVAQEPRRVGERSDALLAALAEHVALREDEPPPRWALEADRFLDRMWFVSPTAAFRATQLRESPAAFRRRGIYLARSTLHRV
jgi:hypothetical protein